MINYGDIILSRCYDGIFIKYGRKTPVLVFNNEFYNVDDPKHEDAKQAALVDMMANIEYIPPELTDSE